MTVKCPLEFWRKTNNSNLQLRFSQVPSTVILLHIFGGEK